MSSKRILYFIIDLLFLSLIISIVYSFIDFKFGQYVLYGDFRFHLFREFIGDEYLHIIGPRSGHNNFPFLSFYSVYYFLKLIPYQYVLIGIFFGIPTMLYLSMRYVLLKIIKFNYVDTPRYFFVCALAFYYSINPTLFGRYGHWPILYGFIFLPLYAYFLFKYLTGNSILRTKYFWALPIFLFLGAVTPHLVLVYSGSALFIYITVCVFFRISLRKQIMKGMLIFAGSVISFAHIVYPVLIGYGQTRTWWESEAMSLVQKNVMDLYLMSKYSNILTAISGTNFYYADSFKYPINLSVGFLIFIFTAYFLARSRKVDKTNIILLISMIISLTLVAGYRAFSFIFDFLNSTFMARILWAFKDSNMYYLLFLIPVLFLFSRLLSKDKLKGKYIFGISVLILFLNVLFVSMIDKKDFNKNFAFITIPKEYFSLAGYLENDKGRNFWIPFNIYRKKTFSENITYFPSPPLWLTKNKELSVSSPEYRDLINTIEEEICEKKCKNVYFLNWIFAAQNLNLVIDSNNRNNIALDPSDNTEQRTDFANSCLERLPNVYLDKSFGNIKVYKSNLSLSSGLFEYKGSIEGLNDFLKNNYANVIYSKSGKEEYKKINILPFSVLNETYDTNWLDEGNNKSLDKVNFVSMLFKGNSGNFHYRGEGEFQKVVFIQKIVLVIMGLLSIIFLIKEKYEKKQL